MQKASKEYEWCRLYQREGLKIEELLDLAISSFEKRYEDKKPAKIYVHQKIDLKTYRDIPVSKDRSIYSEGIVMLAIKNDNIKIKKENK